MDTREFVLACFFVGAIFALVIAFGVLVWRVVNDPPEEDQSQRPENQLMFRMTLLERCANIVNVALLRLGRKPNELERNALGAASNAAAQTILNNAIVPPAQQPAAAEAQPAEGQPAPATAAGAQHVVIDVNVHVNAGQGVNVNPAS